jgi:hypothetical protein
MPIDRSIPLPIHEPAKTMIQKVAELKELEARSMNGEWLPGDLETNCIAANGGRGNVVLRRTNGGSVPSQENIDLICGLRNAAPAMLGVLKEIRAGDAEKLQYCIRWLETTNINQVCIDMLKRYQAMAAKMTEESK